jgi:hypothetical protein
VRTIEARADRTNSGTSPIESYGQVFPELMIEAVTDARNPGRLSFERWDGYRSRTSQQVYYQDLTHVPASANGGLAQAVRFSSPSRSFGSVANLVSSINQVFLRYSSAPAEAASVLTAFSLASFVVDCLPLAPTLYLVGPESECSQVLRLLGCTCSRSVLLGDVDIAALATLPPQLRATLLFGQRDLGRAVTRTLHTSSDRHFRIVRGNRKLDLYGAKVFSTDFGSADGQGVQLNIPPSTEPLPLLTDDAEMGSFAELQPKLLRYRMVCHQRVRDAEVDCSKFVPLPCEEVRTWLAPLCDCPDLREAVSGYLLGRIEDEAGSRFTDFRCVVAEGALSFCHEPDQRQFFIRELADRANALLQGRHHETPLTDRKVGSVLRDLGVHAQRVAEGFKVVLTDSVRERIHFIARCHRVLSLQDGVLRCRHCPGGNAEDSVTQRSLDRP